MECRFDTSRDPRCDEYEISAFANVLHHLTQQSMRLVVLAKKVAVQSLQPLTTPSVCDEGESGDQHVRSGTTSRSRGERLVPVHHDVYEPDESAHRDQRRRQLPRQRAPYALA